MTIRKVFEVSIKLAMADEFLEVASKFIQRVAAREQYKLNYEWFHDETPETSSILEWYRDDEALLIHLDNIRDLYE
jgi:quinol monooxygenase YgiN